MLNILLLTIALNFTTSDFTLITDSKTAPLEKVKEIPFPHFVKVRTKKAMPMELILSSGTRQMWLDKGNTNRKIRLPLFNDLKDYNFKIDYMVIKVLENERNHVYKIKILPRIPADNSFGTEEDRRKPRGYED